jgi:hypothetical protein
VKNNRESNYRIDPTAPSWRAKIKTNLNARKKRSGIPARQAQAIERTRNNGLAILDQVRAAHSFAPA